MPDLFDQEAEKAILSVVIIDPSQVDVIEDRVNPADFHDADLGKLFDALLAIHQMGYPTNDPKIIMPELKTLGVPESVRSGAFIGRLIADGNVHLPHSTYYAEIVRKWSPLRRQRPRYREGVQS